MLKLVVPALPYLSQYKAALEAGWSPDNIRGLPAAKDELIKIAENPRKFLDDMTDLEAKSGPVTLLDGSQVPRLPGYRKWMWDGEFCGSIGIRWQKGTSELPPYCMGHIGYTVVPWKRRRGYATEALKQILPEGTQHGLEYVFITTEPDNIPSRKVIETNGGILEGSFQKSAAQGGTESPVPH